MSTKGKGKGRQSVWTEQIIQRMLELLGEGKSASHIARELSEMAGQELSRNAVIGKLHRMRKAGQIPEGKEPPAQRQQTAARQTASAQSPRKEPAQPAVNGALALETKAQPAPRAETSPQLEVVAEEKGLVADIMDLNQHTCRWPIGDPGEEGFCYCGRRPQSGLPYCEHHAAIAYTSPEVRRRAAG